MKFDTHGRLCDAGRCVRSCATDAECELGDICLDDLCQPENRDESALICTEDGDCGCAQGCVNGLCGETCENDVDCAANSQKPHGQAQIRLIVVATFFLKPGI